MGTNKKIERCPKCNMPLQRNYCLHCGYMTNGVFIGKNKPKGISDVEMYLGERYDKINRNENSALAFFLGPFYFCYNRFLFFGIFCMVFDFLFCQLALLIFYKYTSLTRIFSFLFLRIGYASCANMIYLWLCGIKVKFIKEKYKDKYVDYLRKHDEDTTSFIFVILALVIVVTIFLLVTEFVRNINTR